jgi:hypothetical protein
MAYGSAAPADDPAPPPGPSIWCSDCRTPLRSYYYALDTRPVCPKCRQVYAAQIARGAGSGAVTRALLYGGGAALASALVMGGVILVIGVARIFLAVGVGWAVGKAIHAATGGYLATKYRLMAVVFTYFAIGLGYLSPVLVALSRIEDPPPAVVAAGEDPDIHPRETAVTPRPAAAVVDPDDPFADVEAAIAQLEADRKAMTKSGETLAAEEISSASTIRALGMLLILMLTLPLLAGLAYGMYGAAFTVLGMIYGVYKAWEITGDAIAQSLTGPHKVGTGPISHTV